MIILGLTKFAIPVDTQRCFNVYKTSIRRCRRLIDVETTSCVYWNDLLGFTRSY